MERQLIANESEPLYGAYCTVFEVRDPFAVFDAETDVIRSRIFGSSAIIPRFPATTNVQPYPETVINRFNERLDAISEEFVISVNGFLTGDGDGVGEFWE